MTQVSQSINNPASGGLENHSPMGCSIEFNDWKELTRLQEYISDEYCAVCSYFKVTKGHFGTCRDLPQRKPYDGCKKGSSCALWRLKTCYTLNNVEQKLPEKPKIIYKQLIVKGKKGIGTYPYSSHPKVFHYFKCAICGQEIAVKSGKRKGKYLTQKYRCKFCKHHFSVGIQKKKQETLKLNRSRIMELHKQGNSCRTIEKMLKIGITYKTIWKFVKQCSQLDGVH